MNMANSTFELHQFCYHLQSDTDRALAQQVDETAISNMLIVLTTPALREMLSEEETRVLLETVKNHVVVKARLIGAVQQERIQALNTGRSFK